MKKLPDIYLTVGIIANLALILAFVLFFVFSTPKENELKTFGEVRVPKVESVELERALEDMAKVENLPINIDPTALGRENPYR